MTRMTFKESQDYVMPFGQFEGHSLDQIASTDYGLKYLHWLSTRTILHNPIPHNLSGHAISVYIADPTIRKCLEELII